MPANEYDALISTLPPAPVAANEDQPQANPYDDLVSQLGSAQDAALKASAQVGLAQPPDRAAQVLALSSATRLPADLVDRNLEEVQRTAKLKAMDLDRVRKEHPELAGWLANPNNLAMAQDDMPVLRQLDRAVAGLVAGPGDDPFGMLPKGFKYAPDGSILESRGDGTATIYRDLNELDRELARRRLSIGLGEIDLQASRDKLTETFGPLANVAAGAAASLASSQAAVGTATYEGQQAAADVAAASQDLAPGFSGTVQRGVGGLIADVPLMLAGGPLAEGASALMKVSRARAVIATVTGKTVAKAAGNVLKTAAAVQPLAIREGAADAQQNGTLSGLMNYTIETLIPGAFGRTGVERALVPGVDKLVAGAAGWAPAARHLLIDAGLEGTEEAVTEFAHALFESASGQNPNALHADQLLPRLAAAGAVGGLAGAAFNLPQAARAKFEKDALQLRQSALEADSLAAAFDLARSSKTAERSPEQLQHLIARQTGVAGTTTFFQSEEFASHYEKQGQDPAEVAARMGVDPATYEATRAAGAQLPVPTAGFLAHSTEADRPLLDRATMRADGLTREQIGTASEELRTQLQGEVSQAKQAADQAVPAEAPVVQSDKARIAAEVEAQLVAAGRSPDVARNEAKLVSEPIANLADRFNRQSQAQAEREALAAWRRDHSGNEPDRKSEDWKQALEQAQAKAPVVAPFELYSRYIKGINGPAADQAPLRSLDQGIIPPSQSLAFDDLLKQWRKAHGDRTPVRGGAEWQALVDQAAAVDAANGKSFDQPSRGRIDIGNDKSLRITLLATADRSTFIHEMGHAYLEILSDLATHGGAPDSIVADVATIRAWVGADDKGAFSVDQHEQVARGFERYLMEGKAPSSTLRRAFANFKNWLTRIYQTVLSLKVELTPEVRSVFDRLIASDEAIAAANEEIGNKSPWKTAAEAGMTEDQFRSYLEQIDYRRDRAADFVRARLMHAEFLAESDERERERAEVERQTTAAVNGQPVYQAILALQSGETPAGVELPDGAVFKLSKADLLRFYAPEELAKLPGPQGKSKDLYGEQPAKANRGERVYTTKEAGLSLADAAAAFGFTDGDALFQALTTAPDRETTIAQQVDAEMARRYPDPLVDGSLELLAQGEIADQVAGHVLDREVSALAQKVGARVAPTEILKQVAHDLIAKTKASQLRPQVYWNAARIASREAFEAAAKARDGKPEQQAQWDRKAFDAAQRERFNLHLYRAATAAQEASEKGRTYLGRFDTLDTRQRLGKAGGWEYTVYDELGNAAAVFPTLAARLELRPHQRLPGADRQHPGGLRAAPGQQPRAAPARVAAIVDRSTGGRRRADRHPGQRDRRPRPPELVGPDGRRAGRGGRRGAQRRAVGQAQEQAVEEQARPRHGCDARGSGGHAGRPGQHHCARSADHPQADRHHRPGGRRRPLRPLLRGPPQG